METDHPCRPPDVFDVVAVSQAALPAMSDAVDLSVEKRAVVGSQTLGTASQCGSTC